jgi:hypothetical protein
VEIGLIGSPIFGGDFAQGIGFEEFSNNKLSPWLSDCRNAKGSGVSTRDW